ncbi:DUF3244 domain-containing protein [Xylanibacter caecicola]|uniref:DUF3244 domain-containing protein n=1 Tax=Xylanibacter caecicola TaxID=2736294 RepID=UPI0025896B23|nr:DUF3244 domain-containing protein [Xylanibacter caecicola]
MRKILFIIVCTFHCISGLAQKATEQFDLLKGVMMQLTDVKDYHMPGQHKAPARMPIVSYDNQHLYITPHYNIPDAQIIIRDETDNIIYDINTALTGSCSVIILPQYVMENKYSIELVYSEKHYIGFFIY